MALRRLTNRSRVTFDAAETRVIFAEDWNEMADIVDSISGGLPTIAENHFWVADSSGLPVDAGSDFLWDSSAGAFDVLGSHFNFGNPAQGFYYDLDELLLNLQLTDDVNFGSNYFSDSDHVMMLYSNFISGETFKIDANYQQIYLEYSDNSTQDVFFFLQSNFAGMGFEYFDGSFRSSSEFSQEYFSSYFYSAASEFHYGITGVDEHTYLGNLSGLSKPIIDIDDAEEKFNFNYGIPSFKNLPEYSFYWDAEADGLVGGDIYIISGGIDNQLLGIVPY